MPIPDPLPKQHHEIPQKAAKPLQAGAKVMSDFAEKVVSYLHVGPKAYEPDKSGRKFYEVKPDGTLGRLPFEFLNEDEVDFYKIGPHFDGKGFPDYEGTPVLRFNPRRKRVSDLNKYGRLWIVSDRAKKLFEHVDPEAFEFRPVEAIRSGKPLEGDPYWLCAPIRVLDAVDEDGSEIWISRQGEHYTYVTIHLTKLKLDVVGDAHEFSLIRYESTVIFDDVMVSEIKRAGLTGFIYLDLQSVERTNRLRPLHSLPPLVLPN
ncbi:imm11 family protein [Sphingomonas azotifigens]|uniref:imm11 family protein n=1 Tax=Sphingomonas azotifigens TaxID=330920 RepID=UPI000A069EFD|nr:DUF1629 domain-containing protein [Sphingomonas azotifigens]